MAFIFYFAALSYFVFTNVLPACLMSTEATFPENGVMGSFELSCRCWKIEPASSGRVMPVVLTDELSLQPIYFNN